MYGFERAEEVARRVESIIARHGHHASGPADLWSERDVWLITYPVPNVMDIAGEPAPTNAARFRKAADIDESDIVLLQPTRPIPRKTSRQPSTWRWNWPMSGSK